MLYAQAVDPKEGNAHLLANLDCILKHLRQLFYRQAGLQQMSRFLSKLKKIAFSPSMAQSIVFVNTALLGIDKLDEAFMHAIERSNDV